MSEPRRPAEDRAEPELAGLCRAGGVAAFVLLAYSLATLVLLALGDRHAAATSEAARRELLAAGEALLAADMWHSTGAFTGAILLQSGALLVSVAMLRTRVFGRPTAWVGILTHGLDLVHVVLGPFAPGPGVAFMAVAGPLYLAWFPMVGRRLLALGRGRPSL